MSFTPKYLSQRDPQWINEKLGFDDTVTIGTDGSTLVCLTMLVNGVGYSETPSSMNGKLKDLGSGIGFLGSLIVWPGLTCAFPQIIFRRVIVCRDQPAPLDEINTSLDAGQPLLIEMDRSPSPGLHNHWVVLYARQGDDYLMLDPWPQPPDNAPTSLVARYCFGRPASEFITTVAWFDAIDIPAPVPGPVPASTPAPAPAPAPQPTPPPAPMPTPPPASPVPPRALTVFVSQNAGSGGLRLRDQPATNSNTLVILSAGAELTSLEPADRALPKIGQENQWLHVRDGSGTLGYVAAWYVELRNTPSLAQAAQPLTVLVSSQASAGLHLRDRPSVNGSIREVLMPGTLLTVLEPAVTAQAKIGVVNQWLNVKLPGGMTGYVAAWFVTT